jgi:hypothetical protein
MKLTPEQLFNLNSLANKERVANGTHNLLGGKETKKSNQKRIENGTHHFMGNGDFQRAIQKKRVANGTHPFLDGKMQQNTQNKLLSEGKHNFQNPQTYFCPHCNRTGKGGRFLAFHLDKCKFRQDFQGNNPL